MDTSATDSDTVDRLDPFTDPDFLVDPFPFYERLRATDPLRRTSLGWVAVNYDDCRELLTSPHTRQADPTEWQPDFGLPDTEILQQTVREWIGMSNPPDHERRRAICDRAFSARSVRSLRDLIQTAVDELIDTFEGRGEADLQGEFAYPLPANVICDLLGVPRERRDDIRAWSDAVSLTYDPVVNEEWMRAGIDAARNVQRYFAEFIEERRRNPGDDLMTAFANFGAKGGDMSDHEVASNALLVFLAGHETTSGAIGNGFLEMLQEHNRAQLALVQSGSVPAKGVVEEFMRFAGSVHAIWRVAATDVTCNGRAIPAGSTIIPFLQAASRDPEVYENPGTFDVMRKQHRPHLGFGAGVHYCIGAPLARLEIEIATETLLRRLPKLHLEEPNPEITGGIVSRRPLHLHVSF